MALFHLGKKQEEAKAPACACGGAPTEETGVSGGACCCPEAAEGKICCVKVLGAGCKTCHTLHERACEAVRALGLTLEVAYITDMEQVMRYGVMRMPVLVINEQVASAGKLLTVAEIEALLRERMA